MVKLLIIADDFTGALDTGVQFTSKGIETRVIVDDHGESIRKMQEYHATQVLVLDAETRHLKPEDAYKKVFLIVENAKEVGIPYIYKKTDSALRGNIGSELSALLHASGEKMLPFIPAFPKMNRITKKGIHYIDDLPVSESIFGQDPFEPVKQNSVKDIIHLQSKVEVIEMRDQDNHEYKETGILVFDAGRDEDLERIARTLKKKNSYHILAGCAGFAAVLPKLLEIHGKPGDIEILEQKLFVVCGSVNPITQKQLKYGESCGYLRIYLTAQEKLEKEYWETEKGKRAILRLKEDCENNICCILDSNDMGKSNETLNYAGLHNISLEQVRQDVSKTMGKILKKLLDEHLKTVLLITGGDTLLGFMREINNKELMPVCEVAPGCVLTKLKYQNQKYHIITKSGGFGDEKLLENLIKILKKNS